MSRDPVLIDAHVHFYDCYDRNVFFDSALSNFRAAADSLGLAGEPAGCLVFTESAGYDCFSRFRDEADRGTTGPWCFRRTAEDSSLLAVADGKGTILLIGGRQVATREGLEVLAIGCGDEFPDGAALRDTVGAVLDSCAIAVLPWGFGKWWFRRGTLMSQVVRSVDASQVCLGDNSGRLHGFPAPRLFESARSRSIKILPGTDPLPFPSEARKPGSYGFIVEGRVDPERPAQSLKKILREQRTQPATFGRLESLGRFFRNQLVMALRKHVGIRVATRLPTSSQSSGLEPRKGG